MDLGLEFTSVDAGQLAKQERKQKKRDKKERRRQKKEEKRAKAGKRAASPSSSSGGSDDARPPAADAGAEPEAAAKPARDEWLTAASGDRNVLTGERADQRPTQEAPPEQEGPKVSAKELNPTLAAGGGPAARPPPGGTGVGDGGASWRLKALKRAQALAEAEGRQVDEIVAERHGSLAQLTAQLTSGRAAHSRAHIHAQRDRQRQQQQRDGGEAADYLQDVGSGQGQMRRPERAASLSWRKGRGEQQGAREPQRREADRGGREARREPGSDGREARREAGSDGREARREAGSDGREARREAGSDGRGRARDRERGPDGDRAPDRPRPRPPRNPLGRPEDAAALRGAAAALNTFASDGSFLESFQARADGGAAAEAPAAAEAEAAAPTEEEAGGAEVAAEPEPARQQRQPVAGPPASEVDADNKSAAAALRARLLGRAGGGSSGGSKPGAAAPESAGTKRAQVEVLPSVDARGRAVPGAHGRAAASASLPDAAPGRRPAKLQRFEGGERARYFADDDGRSLDDLVREQRHGGGHEVDATLARNIAKRGAAFREKELDVDAEYDVDGGLELYEKQRRKGGREAAQQRERAARVSDHRRASAALDACGLCLSSAKRPAHLTIAASPTAYLFLPRRDRLAPLHCCIAPTEHCASSRAADEHVWTEMRNFKKCVILMFQAQGLHAVFVETATRLQDLRSHAVLHCIPVDAAAFARAPIVFRKALLEAESEWAQHHAKAAIDTASKGLRGSIPPNFPYFFVEFGLSAGLLHPIDDEEKFGGKDFGRSILAGLLKLGPEVAARGMPPEPPARQQRLAQEFTAAYDEFDWTRQLE